jgi:hypothetical protein
MSHVLASNGVIDWKRSEEPIFVVHVPGLFQPIQPLKSAREPSNLVMLHRALGNGSGATLDTTLGHRGRATLNAALRDRSGSALDAALRNSGDASHFERLDWVDC